MRYRLGPVQTSIGEGGFSDFKVLSENGHSIATFGFADEHEARIARALMIRAISKAVLIVSHTGITRRNSNLSEDPSDVVTEKISVDP